MGQASHLLRTFVCIKWNSSAHRGSGVDQWTRRVGLGYIDNTVVAGYAIGEIDRCTPSYNRCFGVTSCAAVTAYPDESN